MIERGRIGWMVQPIRKYATFQGRARRAEYWYYTLGYWGLTYLSYTVLLPFIPFVTLGLLLPSLAVNVRRLHDIDKSGWFALLVLVPFVGDLILLIWHCTPGTTGPNRYGDDPLQRDDLIEVFS